MKISGIEPLSSYNIVTVEGTAASSVFFRSFNATFFIVNAAIIALAISGNKVILSSRTKGGAYHACKKV